MNTNTAAQSQENPAAASSGAKNEQPRKSCKTQEPKIGAANTARSNGAEPAATNEKDQGRGPSKIAAVVALLERPEGATIADMVEATGWLPHTTRAALTGLKKKGYEITSVKAGGVRTYRAADKRERPPSDGQSASGVQQ